MRRFICGVVMVSVAALAPAGAWAQAEAAEAFAAGKKAFEAGQFAQAMESFVKATQTDPKNPEAFLYLGKAAYATGKVGPALEAWRKTLALAPEEPYAAAMVKALEGELADADVYLRVIQAMRDEGLGEAVVAQSQKLLATKGLTDARRAEAMTLQAEALLELHRAPEAAPLIQQLRTQYAKVLDAPRVELLLGLARLESSRASEGVATLTRIIADHPKSPSAVEAQFYLSRYLVATSGRAAEELAALAGWLSANPGHRLAPMAVTTLVQAYMAQSRLGDAPGPETALNEADKAALAVLEAAGKRDIRGPVRTLWREFLSHLETRYVSAGAHAAATAGVEEMLKSPMPSVTRVAALRLRARLAGRMAMRELTPLAQAGKLGAEMPEAIKRALECLAALDKEAPEQSTAPERAELAIQVGRLGDLMPRPVKVTGASGPEQWGLEIAMAAVRQGKGAGRDQAVRFVAATAEALSRAGNVQAAEAAAKVQADLVAALADADAARQAEAVAGLVTVLERQAAAAFHENVKAGQKDKNEQLSGVQKELVAALVRQAGFDVRQAGSAVERLTSHLGLWVQAGHYGVAEAAYELLGAGMPAAQKRSCELAAARLWVLQGTERHQRMLAAGLAVPKELDEQLARALVKARELQAGLDEADPAVAEARGVWDRVVDHYRGMEMYATAQAAIELAGGKAAPAADRYAALRLADLHYEQARKALDAQLSRYKGRQELALTAEFKAVIAEYQKIVADAPASPEAARALRKVQDVATVFQSYDAFDAAIAVYEELAAFGAKIKPLSEAGPGKASAVESARFAKAGVLLAKARAQLNKEQASRKSGQEPPAKIGAAHAAAIEAYKAFIDPKGQNAYSASAVAQVLAAALDYVNIGAWDAADGVYADLLAAKLPIRRPERLKFFRGLCQVAKVMPDHAREVLTALTATGLRSSGSEPSDTSMAYGEGGGSGTGKGWGDGKRPGGKLRLDGEALAPRTEMLGAGRPEAPPSPAVEPAKQLKSDDDLRQSDELAMAAIRRQQDRRAAQVAALERRHVTYNQPEQPESKAEMQRLAMPVLSEAELARQQKALDAAYGIFQEIVSGEPESPTARQARGEVLLMVDHWRTAGQWRRAQLLGTKFLTDNPRDVALPQLRAAVAADAMAWAAQPVTARDLPAKADAAGPSMQEMLAETSARFAAARGLLEAIVKDFAAEKAIVQGAQWSVAQSHLSQARVVAAYSATLARGQYVRASEELLAVAGRFHDHPQADSIPQMLSAIGDELAGRGYYEEAVAVWTNLKIHYPLTSYSQQAAQRIAGTYQVNLQRPLLAAEAYLELNFERGGSDTASQEAIYQIGVQLRGEKRWVEALHVLEAFVDSFPRHAYTGQALAMVGQIHQANEAWPEAIAAYRRVIDEFPSGTWVRDAQWAIAECTINLSRWREASEAYQTYLRVNSSDDRASEAQRRLGILKDLARYQGLVDEKDQRKAFDAQFQIAEILLTKLANPVKAIIEYRKVAELWPASYLAADSLFKVGTTYLTMGETAKARAALQEMAKRYPTSPLAGSALYMVGQSYEKEATALTQATRTGALAKAQEKAQREAYGQFSQRRMELNEGVEERVRKFKKAGKGDMAEMEMARGAAQSSQYSLNMANVMADQAGQQVEALTASQLADRQDKYNAALRKAVEAYEKASQVPSADKADQALLRMAVIYAEQLKDDDKAMKTYLEIVRQFSGNAVAEDASWRIAQYYERKGDYKEAIKAYESFLKNYRRSVHAGAAQFAVAENYEQLNEWVKAMDGYTNYINNFPEGPMVNKAREQINWIKTYRL